MAGTRNRVQPRRLTGAPEPHCQNPHVPHGSNRQIKGTAITELHPVALEDLWTEFFAFLTAFPEAHDSLAGVELFHPAKVASVPASATAFANRRPHHNVVIMLQWDGDRFTPQARSEASRFAAILNPNASGSANYDDGNAGSGSQEKAKLTFGQNYARLAKLKAKSRSEECFQQMNPRSSLHV